VITRQQTFFFEFAKTNETQATKPVVQTDVRFQLSICAKPLSAFAAMLTPHSPSFPILDWPSRAAIAPAILAAFEGKARLCVGLSITSNPP